MPGGRPTTFDKNLTSQILERICDGESLRSICRDFNMPAMSTVMLWKTKHPEFSDQYEQAIATRAQNLFDELLEIADDAQNDWMERLGSDGQPIGYQLNGDHVQRSRLRVDVRKWALSKMLPKLYGDKIEQVVKNPDGESFRTQSTWTVQPVKPANEV